MKIVYKFIRLLLLVVLVATGYSFLGSKSAKAEEKQIDVTNLQVEKQKGKPLTDGVGVWESFSASADFTIKNGQVKAGDTTTITLPDEFSFYNSSFAITDKNDPTKKVADADIDLKTRKTVTLKYTDYPETKAEVNGNFYFYAFVDHKKVTEAKDIDFSIDVEGKVVPGGKVKYTGNNPTKARTTPKTFSKAGWTVNERPGYLTYSLNINATNENLKNVTVEDKLAFDDGVIEADSITVHKGVWRLDPADNVWRLRNTQLVPNTDYTVSVAKDKKSFTIGLGDVPSTLNLRVLYDVKLNGIPADHTKYNNNATLKADGKGELSAKAYVTYLLAGGEAEGSVNEINIHKIDANTGSSLAGAVFDVYESDAAGNKVGAAITRVTTDANGKAHVENLVKSRYLLEEVSTPAGYKKPTKLTSVTATRSGILVDGKKTTAKSEPNVITIANEKDNLKVAGEKTWVDDNNKDGNRPSEVVIELRANGKVAATKTITAKDNWKYSFENLPRYDKDNKEITYSVTEKEVSGYTAEYSGYNVKNIYKPELTKISVEKRWNDENDKDKLRPASVKVQLFADDKAVGKVVELKAENNWKHTFDGLSAKINGALVKYDVREVEVPAGYTVERAEKDSLVTLTNVHKPVVPPTPKTTKAQFKFTKKLEGRELKAGEFKFELLENGKVIQTKSNAADGTIVFDEISYDKEGVHTYIVREVVGTDTAVTYDRMEAEVTVKVTKDEKTGLLNAEVIMPADSEFNNKVTPPTPPAPSIDIPPVNPKPEKPKSENSKSELPKTGLDTTGSAAGFGLLLAGVALAVRKRKEEK